jgi:diphosphomevalonate decarboxylase
MGNEPDGSDCQARGVAQAEHWPLEVAIAITAEEAKKIGSSEGMLRSAATSACFSGWVDTAAKDLAEAKKAVLNKDFEKLASVSESSCLKMHAVMLSSQPALMYWNGATVECMEQVRELRAAGQGVFFTIDAGPQVKAVCLPGQGDAVAASLARIPGVHRVIRVGLGSGAHVVNNQS